MLLGIANQEPAKLSKYNHFPLVSLVSSSILDLETSFPSAVVTSNFDLHLPKCSEHLESTLRLLKCIIHLINYSDIINFPNWFLNFIIH